MNEDLIYQIETKTKDRVLVFTHLRLKKQVFSRARDGQRLAGMLTFHDQMLKIN